MVDFYDKEHNKIVIYNEVKFDNSNFNEITKFVDISFDKKVDFFKYAFQ